jgi:VWFA-related protein
MKLLKLLFCLAVFALVAGAQNRRSLVFFFDFSSMSAADQVRAQEAAVSFATKNVAPTDVVSVMTFTSELKVVQDFSGDRDVLLATLGKIVPATTPAGGADSLRAIQDAAKILEAIPGTKQLIYFSSGVAKAGVDSQTQLEASINAAARAQVKIYPIDITGLAGQR